MKEQIFLIKHDFSFNLNQYILKNALKESYYFLREAIKKGEIEVEELIPKKNKKSEAQRILHQLKKEKHGHASSENQ